MPEPETVFDLMKAVACNLAGRPVRLRMRNPSAIGTLAQTCMLSDGSVLIDLAPGQTHNRTLWCLLHEAAHARLHYREFGKFAPGEALAMPEGSHDVVSRPATLAARQEGEADLLARKWEKWAEERWQRYVPGSELEGRLHALMEWTG